VRTGYLCQFFNCCLLTVTNQFSISLPRIEFELRFIEESRNNVVELLTSVGSQNDRLSAGSHAEAWFTLDDDDEGDDEEYARRAPCCFCCL
jgi:hypothetical protein